MEDVHQDRGAQGDQAFDWCRDRGIVGVGWSCIYDGLSEVPPDPLTLLEGGLRRGVSPVKMVIQRMKSGEFVWLHSRGEFYLCRILDCQSSRRAICRTAFAGGLLCFTIVSFPRRSIALIAASRFNAELW